MTKESSVVPIRPAKDAMGTVNATAGYESSLSSSAHYQEQQREDKVIQQNLARLPMPINRVRDNANKQLKAAIQELFNHVDDALFELADRAQNNLEQNGFFESMREIRIHRRNMEKGFLQNLDKEFALLLSPDDIKKADADYTEASVDDLNLVSKEELEETVAVDALVNRSWTDNRSAIQALSLRMGTLLSASQEKSAATRVREKSKNSDDSNPLSPRTLANSFVVAAQGVTIDIKAKLVLFKLFERHVIAKLGDLLEESNRLLNDMGVTLPQNRHRKASDRSPQQPQVMEPQSRSPYHHITSQDAASLGEGDPRELFQTLQSLLEPTEQSPQVVQDMPSHLVSSVLFSALSNLQRSQAKQNFVVGHTENQKLELLSSTMIESAIEQLSDHQHSPETASVDKHSQDVIKLVDMLFTFMLQDSNVPDPIKLLLIRLQIPYIKVAVADENFFKTDGHPARRLLNEMATASLGWSGDLERLDSDPFFRKINDIVDRILLDFNDNLELFSELLTDFVSFVEKERRRVSLFEKRTIDAEDGKAKTELGRQKVSENIEGLAQRYSVPSMVDNFVKGPWSNILFLIYMRKGLDSDEWNAALLLAENLMWSCQPIGDDVHQQKLQLLLPELNQSLKKGLEDISFNPAKQNKFITTLREHHLSLFDQYLSGQRAAASMENDLPESNLEENVLELPVSKTSDSKAPVSEVPPAETTVIDVPVLDTPISIKSEPNESFVDAAPEPVAVPQDVDDSALALDPAVSAADIEEIDKEIDSMMDIAGNDALVEVPVEENAPAGDVVAVENIDVSSNVEPVPTTQVQELEEVQPEEVQAEKATESRYVEDDNNSVSDTVNAAVETPTDNSANDLAEEESAPQVSQQYVALVDNFMVGVWFERTDGDTSYRCRLAAIIRATDKFIFVNRSGVKVAEETRESLALQLQSGGIRTLDDTMLFDRALESVISNLKSTRKPPTSPKR